MRRGVACSILVLLTPALADTLNLRSGGTVTGLWIDMDAEQITFRVDNRIQHYPRADVAGITFDREALQPTSASPPYAETGSVPPSPPEAVASIGPQEPNNLNQVYLVDETERLLSLERTPVFERRNAPAMGGMLSIGKTGTRYWDIEKAASPARFASRVHMVFVVKLASGIDPATWMLYPLETVKDSRRLRVHPKNNNGFLTIATTITRYGESSYAITAGGSFPPGEYAFIPKALNEAYCFGIDAAAPAGSLQ